MEKIMACAMLLMSEEIERVDSTIEPTWCEILHFKA